MEKINLCVVCGARCGSTARTFPFIPQYSGICCDSVCAKAWKNGLTRGLQIEQDVRHDDCEYHYDEPPARRARSDTLDYNRGYLATDFA